MSDNNEFTHEFQVYSSDLNAGTMGTGKFLLFDNNINALKVLGIDNIKIGGGSNGRVLATDGEGNLRWISAAAGTGGISSYDELDNLPDLSVYATESWVTSQGFITSVDTGNFTFTNNNITTDDGQSIVLSIQGYDNTYTPPYFNNQSWTFGFDGYLTTVGLALEHAQITAEEGVNIFDANVGKNLRIRTHLTPSAAPWVNDWIFDIDGTLTVPGTITKGDNLTLNSGGESGYTAAVVADGDAGRVFLRTDDGTTLRTWEFDINGNLKLPAGGDIVDSAGQSVLGDGTSDRLVNGNKSLILASDGNVDVNGHIAIKKESEYLSTIGKTTTIGSTILNTKLFVNYNEVGITSTVDVENMPDETATATVKVGAAVATMLSTDDDAGNPVTQYRGQLDVSYTGITLTLATPTTETNWVFDNNNLKLPAGGDIVDSAGNSVLGGSGATNEITNTDPEGPTYSVSVGTDGVVTMVTSRGNLEFGALPEPGAPTHFHIMRPAGQEGSSDLYFGDDYNYVKLPSSSYSQQGVEIGSSLNQGAVSVWRFGTDGALTLPAGGDIKDSNGTSVLGGSSITHMGNTNTFMDVDTDDDVVRMQTTSTNYVGDYTFNVDNSGFTSATWNDNSIVIAGPSVDVYTAVWALTDFSSIFVTIGGVEYQIQNGGSSTPGHPQDVTLWTNNASPVANAVIDSIYIEIRTGEETFIEVDGNDIRMEAGDDVRIYAKDTFELVNRSGSDPIQITVDDNNSSKTFQFKVDGNLELPSGGTIVDSNGNDLLSGSSSGWGPGNNIVQNVDTDLRLVVQDPGENNYRLDLAIEDTSGGVKSRLEIDYDRVQIETWAGQNQWRFESSGEFRIPGNINTYDKDIEIIAMNAGTAGNITIKAVSNVDNIHYSQVQLTQSGVTITADMDGTPGGKSFEFRDTGVLALPAGGDIVDSNGASVLGGGGGTTLPADAAGVLKNDGSGTLSWSSLDIQDLTDNGNLLNFTQTQADWEEMNGASAAYIQNKPTLITSYYQLNDLPTLFNGDYLSLTGTPSLANVATTGMYGDLSGTPTSLSNFLNDPGFITASDLAVSTGGSGSLTYSNGLFTYEGPTVPTDISELTDNTNLLSSGGGTTLPADASGYLNNNGSGTLSWVAGNPTGSGMLPYNAVTVVSNTTTADWTEFTLSGTMDSMWDYNNSVASITLSSATTYGRTATPNTKNMWVIDAKVNSNNYLVIEFPTNPTPGDVFTVTSIVITQTVNAGSFVVGESYTITSLGNTDWLSIGAQYSGIGQTFVATGVGSGTGTATTPVGAKKLILKPATGQRARTMSTGQNGPVMFGQGGTYDYMFLDYSSQNVNSPITWAYAGLIDGIPTWYHTYF